MLSLVGRIKPSLNCNPSLELRYITNAQYTYTQSLTGQISKLGLHSLQSYRCVRITFWITLVGELIGSGVRPSSYVVNNFKHLLLQNRFPDQSQILCGASLGRGNDITKMAATPIYGKNLQKYSSQEPAGRFSRNLVCSIGDSSPS